MDTLDELAFEAALTILAGDLEFPGSEEPANLETAKLIIEAIQSNCFCMPIFFAALQRLGLTGPPKRIQTEAISINSGRTDAFHESPLRHRVR